MVRMSPEAPGLHHIMEVQLNLRGLSDVRIGTHAYYKKVRAVLPEEAVSVVIDQLTNTERAETAC